MVPSPLTGGRGDKSLMVKSPVRMTSSNSDFLKHFNPAGGPRGAGGRGPPVFMFKAFNKIKNILKFSFLLVGGEVSGLDC